MNKFKLSLFAVIAAGVVGCGGGGGGGGGTGTTSYAPGEVVVDDGIDRFPYVAREHILKHKQMVLIRVTRYRHFGLKTLI